MTLFKRMSVGLFLGANICTILLLWLCVALTFMPPALLPRLSLLTLAFPVLLCVNLLFIAFWLIFKARLAWIPIAGTLLIGGYVLDYCPLNLSSNNSRETTDSTLTIITYNVGYINGNAEKQAELLRFLSTANADIVCLQELSTTFLADHKTWLDTTSYHSLQSSNVTILSRLHFLGDTIHIDYPTRTNHSIACWIDCYGDSLLLVNNHLESNHLSPEERDEYTNAITDPKRQAIKNSSKMLLSKLSEAAAYRGAQAESIRSLVKRNADHEAIVCGDLNETPISYTYQRLARCLTSAYREAGCGPGFTFNQRSFPVRIDHLFHSAGWTCSDCRIDHSISTSDHYPLVVRLSKKVR